MLDSVYLVKRKKKGISSIKVSGITLTNNEIKDIEVIKFFEIEEFYK